MTQRSILFPAEIDENDAIREGTYCYACDHPLSLSRECRCTSVVRADGHFLVFWDRINARRGYSSDDNPWVWRLEFEVVEHNRNREQETRHA